MYICNQLLLTIKSQIMISKELGKDIKDPEKRIAFLKDNCDAVETKSYMKRFSPEQLAQMKDDLSENAIEINDIDEEKKIVVDSFKLRLKPLIEDRKMLLTGLKNKSETVKDTVYKFIDPIERTVGFYNSEGDLIEGRPAYAEELQTGVFQVLRETGTDNE